jgi:hypothetical protein
VRVRGAALLEERGERREEPAGAPLCAAAGGERRAMAERRGAHGARVTQEDWSSREGMGTDIMPHVYFS